ncbi:HTH-type transcriptional repressor PurR [Abditibacteriota bacterium]|nr:HTH-type transcriptional repressor PurR [Abditibacteriota bacterium]
MSTSAPNRRPDSITMSDIAQRAGVSRPTVSIILNDRHETVGIAAETRERVLLAARELGYRRNALARAVKTGRSLTLGFLAGDADLEYSSRAFSGILDEADEKNYTVKRFRLYDRPEDQAIIERCSEHRLDGIIVNDTGLARNVELIRREFEGRGVPVVWLDPKGPQDWGVQVRPNDEGGMLEAVHHLVELGHKRIAFIGGIEGVGTGVPRLKGFQRGMEAAGLPTDLVRWTQWQSEKIELAVDDLLAEKSPPTAFMCGSDAMALGFLRRLHRRGKSVPQDTSVVGFGNLSRVDLADPSLSTVHVPYHSMGRSAVTEILSLLEDPGQAQNHKEVLYATNFIARESSGPAPTAS